MGPKELWNSLHSVERQLLEEAVRRWNLQPLHTGGDTLTTAWLGLGTEAQYRPGVKKGLFLSVGHMPEPRIDGWWQLTYKGAEVVAWLLGIEDSIILGIRKIFQDKK